MFKKISLQWRLTLLSSLLITICCIGLTVTLNISAFRMADTIDAFTLQPAIPTEESLPDIITPSYAMSSTTATEAKHIHFMDSILYTVIAVLIGGVLTYYISGKALEPVRALNEQVKNINTHNLNESLEVPSTEDELAELTASFNDMTDKLAESFAVQKRFSADAAHELRTPITVLQTQLDVFRKKKEHTPEEYEALTITFQKQISRLRSLVTELLDIANMEHTPDMQKVSLSRLFDGLCKELTDTAKSANVSISYDKTDIVVFGDYSLLYRALYNLIENAVKYNVSGGSVKISSAIKDHNTIITIADTGIGIPDSMKKQIFEPFCRVDKSRSREMGGAGLGLSMVNGIIKRHGGTITVSDNNGSGSCFTVILPREN